MKYIKKNGSPKEFEEWKKQEEYPMDWDRLPSSEIKDDRKEEGILYYSKAELRSHLIYEQGFICGYCQDEVKNNHTCKIEHIKARGITKYKKFTFDYENMIICCQGIKSDPPPKELHCDTIRSNEDLVVTPLMENCHEHFRYDENGHINHETAEGQDTIEKLNLDTPKLINRRREVIEGWLPPRDEISDDDIGKIIQYMQDRREDDSFEPFCQVIVNILTN